MSRVLVLGGLAGPIVVATVVINCAAIRPGYSHVSQFLSELGEAGGPNAVLMNYAGFMVPGVLIFLSGLGLGRRLPRSALTVVGSFSGGCRAGRGSPGIRS